MKSEGLIYHGGQEEKSKAIIDFRSNLQKFNMYFC